MVISPTFDFSRAISSSRSSRSRSFRAVAAPASARSRHSVSLATETFVSRATSSNGSPRNNRATTANLRLTKNASAHFNLGLTLYNAGRYSEAIESYKEVVKLRPTLAVAYFNLGLTYYAINDKPAAMAQYETLKGIDAEMAKQLYDAIKH